MRHWRKDSGLVRQSTAFSIMAGLVPAIHAAVH
jgi:hypothetical protein